jgi:hypothetical protein
VQCICGVAYIGKHMIEASITYYDRREKVSKPQKGDMGTFTVIWKVQRVDRRTSK